MAGNDSDLGAKTPFNLKKVRYPTFKTESIHIYLTLLVSFNH